MWGKKYKRIYGLVGMSGSQKMESNSSERERMPLTIFAGGREVYSTGSYAKGHALSIVPSSPFSWISPVLQYGFQSLSFI
jgi:hypothetical protein